ncbi:DMT family transporter [Helicobacter trogontum]|uniref:DMT family transporter n=1 Tax=Helicobacter trogontum TaxID=50960 RepID=A0A099VFG4_9HELI|nr:DMT family transporter [Helicobacter trogontum]MDY5185202.1 DMT family transporter [Helicobacter trogontum]TLD84348.1 DMT family transporter [Helicobacter trogontum]TLD99241.1 DMT family transporter [Helicobacter trogontum]
MKLLMILAMMGWGLVWPLSKIMSETLNPEQASCIRFIIVSLSFLPIMYIYKIPFKIPKNALLPVLLTGLFNTAYSYLMYIGLLHGDAGSAGVIAEVLPIIIAAFLYSFIKKTTLLKREKWALFFGILAGIFLIDLFENWRMILMPFNIIFLLAALVWAMLIISSRYATEHISAISLSFYSSLCTAILLLPSFLYYGVAPLKEVGVSFWILALVTALFCTTFSTTTYYRGLYVLGVTQGGIYALLVPPSALLFAWLILGELPQWHTIIGGLISIFTIYLMNYYNSKHFRIFKR